jgi:hypothetical protein
MNYRNSIPDQKGANNFTYRDLLAVLSARAQPGQYLEVRCISQERRAPRQSFIPVKNLSNLYIRQRKDEHLYFGVLPRIETGNGRADGVALGTLLF